MRFEPKIPKLALYYLSFALTLGFAGAALAQSQSPTSHPPSHNLANQATNPAAPLTQLQLQNIFIPESDNAEGYSNQFIVQPVIPFKLSDTGYFRNLITRTTLPVVKSADPDGPLGSKTGLGDMTVLFALPHADRLTDTFGFEWAPLAAVVAPTATSKSLGSGKWSLGPGLLVIGGRKNLFTTGDSLQFGAYGYNVWDVGGDSDRAGVNELFLGPLVVYHFKEFLRQPGWYLRWTDELMSFDWEKGGEASIPLGGAIGRVFSIGHQPVNIFLGADRRADRRGVDAEWDIKLNLALLFTE
jgi:hypothetical protein